MILIISNVFVDSIALKSYTIYEDDLSFPDKKFVVNRFVSYGKGLLKDETISALVEQIEHIERVENIAEMTNLLVRG